MAMLEKLALLKIALWRAPASSNASWASDFDNDLHRAGSQRFGFSTE
jgi:hypothetical protein